MFSKSLTASHTKCMFSEKCNSCRIAIQWLLDMYKYLGFSAVYRSGARVRFFLEIRDLGSPTICAYRGVMLDNHCRRQVAL